MIYAKQVAPEYQESPLMIFDEWPNDLAVCGNRDYMEHCPEVFERVYNVLYTGELAEILENRNGWKDWYKNITEAITEYLPPEKAKYSTKDIGVLKKLVLQYAECSSREEDSILCAVLSVVTGEKWDCQIIRGCSQSDWNYIYYSVEHWSREAINAFEMEYFNTGSEWIVHAEDSTPEEPEDISGYSIYCYSWNDEGIAKEIANSAGGKPEDVILWAFDGYTKAPAYRKVG